MFVGACLGSAVMIVMAGLVFGAALWHTAPLTHDWKLDPTCQFSAIKVTLIGYCQSVS
jgi:hypothetical protein